MEGIEEREAEYRKKMIEVTIKFWTDNIAEGEGKIVPKECWERGVVRVTPNDSHGIRSQRPLPFNTMTEILPKIEQVLKNHGIKVVRKETAKGLYIT